MQPKPRQSKEIKADMAKSSSAKISKKPYQNRRNYDCPPQLAALLQKIRWLDPETPLIPLQDAVAWINQNEPGKIFLELADSALQLALFGLRNELGLEPLPTDLIEYVLRDYSDVNEAARRYEDYRISRAKLGRLVIFKSRFKSPLAIASISQDLGGANVLQTDENGVIRIVNDSFGEAVNGAILDRIRKCEICGHIFWAENINSKTCSPSEAAALRNRKSRAKVAEKRIHEHDALNYQRRENYKRNKKLKELRENRNGNL